MKKIFLSLFMIVLLNLSCFAASDTTKPQNIDFVNTEIPPYALDGYVYTNGAKAAYVVAEISESVYNQAVSQPRAPVFVVYKNNSSPVYYKYTLPDLTIYKTGNASALTGPTIYTGNTENGYFIYRDIDTNGNIELQKYTKNNSSATGVYQNTYTSVSGNFFYVTGNGAIHVRDVTGPGVAISGNFIGNSNVSNGGGAIYTNTNTNISSIEGNFIYNSNNGSTYAGEPGGGAIYIMGGNVGDITANFIGNYSSKAGGAIYNNGTINRITGDFVYNYANDFSWGNGVGRGAAIYNSGTIDCITGDFIANGSGISIYNTGKITSLSGNFIGNNGAIYNSGSIGIITPSETQIIFGTLLDTIINEGRLDFDGLGDIYLYDVTGTGSTKVTSSNVFLISGANIYQNSLQIDTGTLTASANGLQINSITNDGTINLLGGTLSSDISGDGAVNIKGEVTSCSSINQSINIVNGAALSIAANNTDGPINNEGTLTLFDGAINHTINGTGHTYVVGDVNINSAVTNALHINDTGILTIAANNFEDITNNGELYLTSGEISGLKHIYGIGTTNLSGDITARASVFSGTHIVNSGQLTLTGGFLLVPIYGDGSVINTGNLYVSADNVGSNITNNGWISLSSGVLEHGIYGGTIMVTESESVSSLADYLGDDSTIINNYGKISLTSGTLYGHIQGDGNINIVNTVNSCASNLGGSIYNDGVLNLTGGALSSNLTGTGDVIISGDVFVGTDVDQNISVVKTGTLSMSPLYMHTDILNDGVINLQSGGTLTQNIFGTGTTNIDALINSDADKLHTAVNVNNLRTLNLTGGTIQNTIYGSGDVINTGILNSSATYLKNDNFTNNGTLNLTGGTLTKNIYGTGNTNITNDVIVGANSLELQNIILDFDNNLIVGSNTITVNDATLNGTVQIAISKLSKNSSDYAGGKMNVNGDLCLGDNSTLQLIINPNALQEHEQTNELSIFNVSGTQYGTFGKLLANNRFSIVQENNNYIISLGMTLDDVIEANGGSANDVNAGAAWDSAMFDSLSNQQILQDKLWYLSQYNPTEYIKLLDNIIPIGHNVASIMTRSINSVINSQFANRLSAIRNKQVGRAGGDTNFDKLGLWIEGLYNLSELSSNKNIDSSTLGFTIGGEINFNDKLTIGLGYTNTSSSISSSPMDIDAAGNTVSVYAGYTLQRLYFDTIFGIESTSYKQKNDLGNDAKYKATSVSVNTLIGYKNEFANIPISPEIGVRYITTVVGSYEDTVGQTISYDDANTLTLVANAKYYENIKLNLKNSLATFVPEIKLGFTYDIVSSDNVANVKVGNTSYVVNGEKLNPFGVNFGVGTLIKFNRFDFGIAYDLEWRNKFISHTGKVKGKYVF